MRKAEGSYQRLAGAFLRENRRECERVINRVLGSGLSIASDFEEFSGLNDRGEGFDLRGLYRGLSRFVDGGLS